MKYVTGYVQSLPNGRLTSCISGKQGGHIAFTHCTPEETKEAAEEVIAAATKIAEAADQAIAEVTP